MSFIGFIKMGGKTKVLLIACVMNESSNKEADEFGLRLVEQGFSSFYVCQIFAMF